MEMMKTTHPVGNENDRSTSKEVDFSSKNQSSPDWIHWPGGFVAEYERKGYWKRETLGQSLGKWAVAFGDRTAIVDHQGQISYAALDHRVSRLAGGLQGIGIGSGDHVLVQLPNTTSFVVVSFALFRLGAIPIFVMPAQRSSDVSALCELAQPKAIIIQDRFLGFDYRSMARDLAACHESLGHIIVDGENEQHHRLADLDDKVHLEGSPNYKDIACLLLSGGTTGTPKLIPRTHADYAYNARASARLCGLSKQSVYLAALPAAHNFTLACPGILGTLFSGGRVVMAKTPGGDETFPLISREEITFTALVPSILGLWLEQREWDDTDLSSLEFVQVGGARLMPDMARRVEPSLGCKLQQVFGMAEGLVCYTRHGDTDDIVINSQGRPLCDDDEIRVVNSDDADVVTGEQGELLVRGPYTIRGYYRAPTHNRIAFTQDGYYRTGDLVRRLANGNLVVEGRIKEQINRAGEKIATAEIEEHLRYHSKISDVVLLAVADDTLGERSRAVIIAEEEKPELVELHSFLLDRGLPSYKLPDEIDFVTSWPLTAVGKIDKQRLAGKPQPKPRERPTFVQQARSVGAPPLELAVQIALSALEDRVVIYERDGEWSIGLGCLAEVTASADGVRLQCAGLDRKWPGSNIIDDIDKALQAIPFRGWRSYGTATFELSRMLHKLSDDGSNDALLRLTVPRMEYRIRTGRALLRATEKNDLPRLVEALEQAEESWRYASERSLENNYLSDQKRLKKIQNTGGRKYRKTVERAISEITAKKYEKVVLSRCVPLDQELDVVSSYLSGRKINQPVRSFLILAPDNQVAGFSPETVVEVDADGWVTTQPLAGTRSLSTDEEENAALAHDLESDPKEIAEHAVSVKLAFEELSSVCKPGSVSVSEFMKVRRRGAVQHLASRLVGRLQSERGHWQAFKALFPAVTASGIPKREAIEAIGRLESTPRGLYSGCVLLVDDNGLFDAALVLRTLFKKGDQSWLQAGAGVVALSTPEREFQETCEKLKGVAQGLIVSVHGQSSTSPEADSNLRSEEGRTAW